MIGGAIKKHIDANNVDVESIRKKALEESLKF